MRHAKIRRVKTLEVARDKHAREMMENKVARVRNLSLVARKRAASHLLRELLARSEGWAQELADEVERLTVVGRA